MSEPIKIAAPLTEDVIEKLRAGDKVLITGVIYTARDAAHKRLIALLDEGKALPFDIKGQFIYYVGPTPAKPGAIIGSAGPTTSGRMDAYTPALIARSIKKAEIIAYEDLGPEAIRRLEVRDFPAIVANDAFGGDLFEEGVRKYRKVG